MRSIPMKIAFRTWPIQAWVAFFLAATLFAVPLSSTAKSIFAVTALVLIVASPIYRQDLRAMLLKSWCQAAIVLFLIAVLASFWSPGTWHERLTAIEKYSKLLYLPILVAGFQDARARSLSLNGYLCAMVVTCFVSILAVVGVIPLHDAEASGLFRNHIMTGYMMAFAAYLSSFLCMQTSGKVRIVYALLTLLFSYHVFFINNGRTGYVVYLMLMVLLMVQSFSWRQAFLGSVLGGVLVGITCYFSPVMMGAVQVAMNDCKLYAKNEKDTSLGYRVQFHDYAYSLFKRHPWCGNGTAAFMHLYHEENPIPTRGEHLLEPHSQYWLVDSEFGLIGVLALFFFFGSLWVASRSLSTLKPLAFAVLLPFMAGNLTDSLLFYSGTGYFFIIFMALCLGEQKRITAKESDY
jgi:O-antigen ligase